MRKNIKKSKKGQYMMFQNCKNLFHIKVQTLCLFGTGSGCYLKYETYETSIC